MPPKGIPRGKAKAKAKAKAGAKAKAKAKARGGVPARIRLRRPAAALPAAVPPAAEPGAAGAEVDLASLSVRELLNLGKLLIKGTYWEASVVIAGRPKGIHHDTNGSYLQLLLEGTQSEAVLRFATTKDDKIILVHLCDKPCSTKTWRDDLIHVDQAKTISGPEEDWMTNLVRVAPGPESVRGDELGALRREARDLIVDAPPPGEEGEKRREPKEPAGEKDGKKKKDKREGKEKESKKLKGKKSLQDVYGGTGMDPQPSKRKSYRKSARKLAKAQKKKKKKKARLTSSSGSGSSSAGSPSKAGGSESGDSGLEENLFGENSLVRLLSKRYPGVLTADWIRETQEYLMNAQGQMWSSHISELPPVGVHYFRSHVAHKMSGPMAREFLSLVYTLDLMVQGHMALAADVVTQRLKSLLSTNSGIHFSVSQRLELLPHDRQVPASLEETQEAAKAAKAEEQVMARASKGGRPWGSNASENPKGGKGREGKGKKGKSKDHKGRDEGKSGGASGQDGRK